jgi:hypothetical protein
MLKVNTNATIFQPKNNPDRGPHERRTEFLSKINCQNMYVAPCQWDPREEIWPHHLQAIQLQAWSGEGSLLTRC